MPRNRARLVNDDELPGMKPTQPAAVAETVTAPTEQPKRKAKAVTQHTSIYLPLDVAERLRVMAFEERKSRHELIMEGIRLLLASRDQ